MLEHYIQMSRISNTRVRVLIFLIVFLGTYFNNLNVPQCTRVCTRFLPGYITLFNKCCFTVAQEKEFVYFPITGFSMIPTFSFDFLKMMRTTRPELSYDQQ